MDAGETARSSWWKTAVFYQVYPRSFCDASGDGVGDLEGVRRRLDHLVWLGVDALWLSPFYRSPMRDFGYDVADHCAVDPLFGSLADFDRLLADAHARGLRVIVDFVPNHTSDQHPWFVESRASRGSPRRGWYLWRDGTPERPPNNWREAFGDGPAWSYDEATGQWYLHLFLREQPDLDWSHPGVEAAMHGVLRFWLDRGVDGFRMDVIHLIGKDPALPDLPPERARLPACAMLDDPRTHPLLRRIRGVLEAYPGERVMVGEVALPWTEKVAAYYGAGDELHLAFNFAPLFAPWDAAAFRARVDEAVAHFDPRDAWPVWALSNHDNRRHRTRYGSEARARAAALLLLALRGTPFLYAGEELGLADAVVEPARRVDPGGRDGCRAPIPWDAAPGHGFSSAEPWLPWPPDAGRLDAASQRSDPGSMLHLYRRLLAERRASPALREGAFAWLPGAEGALAWRRDAPGDARAALVSFVAEERALPLEGRWTVVVASDGRGEGERYAGRLAPDQALLLRRER